VPISRYVAGSGVGFIVTKDAVTAWLDILKKAATDPSYGGAPPSQVINSDGNVVKTTVKATLPGPMVLLVK
jgi:hypothetical protein